ncbi:USP10 [Lepeophtheirus salmonis]|uniref:ubiquitinyl hydrolase 1 n=1 Tax=Lepeophtheirus salmonis TaxID=72036 RepID=A0A7R8HE24_LEPSM|nr:USP10 [Lepeophtheirus salmonis]CAF3021996.1 USP10 [Lepeophtheirus salmonis]
MSGRHGEKGYLNDDLKQESISELPPAEPDVAHLAPAPTPALLPASVHGPLQQAHPHSHASYVPYPNVYINNVTANVNLHHSVPPGGADGEGVLNPPPPPPPPVHVPVSSCSPPLITAYPLHHLLLPGYNVSLSLPPPHHPSNILPIPRGLTVIRSPILDMQKSFYIQQQQQQHAHHTPPPNHPNHPHRFPFNNQPPPPPLQFQEPITKEQQVMKQSVIEFGGPPIYQDMNNGEEEKMNPIREASPDLPSSPPPSMPSEEKESPIVNEPQVITSEKTDTPSPAQEKIEKEPKVEESLLKKKNTGNKTTARISPNNASVEEPRASIPPPITNVDYITTRDGQLAEFLKKYVLNHKSFFVKPRGLSNRSNWCFVNAILQALIGCPPFFNLIRALPPLLLENGSVLKSLSDFMSEFSPMEKFPKQHHRRNKKTEDLMIGKGRQEDAEEFLTFLLNRVNDEMLALMKKLDDSPGEEEMKDDDDNSDWKEVGPKNKGCVTRRQIIGNTPLASMVQGQIRSCVTHSSSEPTATLQPFFTLQLDLQSDNIHNVSDALINNFSMESLDGIDELPPVLILHLKRFIYNETSGGCQKLLKRIDFPVDLEIAKEILSPNSKTKYHAKQRQYKLFGVVYHNGGEATKGHYVTDVYHTGLSTWLRCDDCTIKGDTMVGSENLKKSSNIGSLLNELETTPSYADKLCIMAKVPQFQYLKPQEMFTRKNDGEAEKHRQHGNAEYNSSNITKAFQYYSLGIIKASPMSEVISKLYANRSACLFSLGQYEEALLDIEEALSSNCHSDLVIKAR